VLEEMAQSKNDLPGQNSAAHRGLLEGRPHGQQSDEFFAAHFSGAKRNARRCAVSAHYGQHGPCPQMRRRQLVPRGVPYVIVERLETKSEFVRKFIRCEDCRKAVGRLGAY